MRAALTNCGFEFPLRRIVANLAPASLRKAGPGLDLAIAAALLAASGQLDWAELRRVGAGRRARPRRLGARRSPASWRWPRPPASSAPTAIVVPAANGPEAALVEGIEVIPIESLEPAAGARRRRAGRPTRPAPLPLRREPGIGGPDLADLRGQRHLRHALEVAAAGGHSLLMVGPPGAGKSLAAARLPSILPPLAPGEALEVARIASACGRLAVGPGGGRPFRAPHHTISPAGPGRRRQPAGAGRGDPGPSRRPLPRRALRVPPRRARGAAGAARDAAGSRSPAPGSWQRLPCRFMLVAAANPCPCGRGEADPECSCAPLADPALPGRGSAAPSPTGSTSSSRSASPAPRRSAARRGSPRRRCGNGSTRPASGRRSASAQGRCNAEMTPAEARECGLERRRRRRCSPRPTRGGGSAAAPTTGSCGWRGRSPTSPGRERDRARADGPGAATAAGGTASERRPGACADLPAAVAAARRPRALHREGRDRRPGLALAGTAAARQRGSLSTAVAPQAADATARGGRGDPRARLSTASLEAAGCWAVLPPRRRSSRRRSRDAADAPWALIGRGDPALLAELERSGRGRHRRRRPAGELLRARGRPRARPRARGGGHGRGQRHGLRRSTPARTGARSKPGRTVAVLGCGADVAYPATHRSLWRRIQERGLVLSELPPGTGAWRWAFPARNRIMAALAGMTVVVEAAERSGSLITADLAADLGRDLGAVPGPVNSRASAGPNALLAGGACLVRDAQDVLDAMLGPGVGDGRAPRPAAGSAGAGRGPGRRSRRGAATCDAVAAAPRPRRRRGGRGARRPRGARLRHLLDCSAPTRGPSSSRRRSRPI